MEQAQTTAAKIEEFFAAYQLRRYSKGQVLILAGEDAGSVYYLVSGKVKMYDVTYRGEELVLNVFKPPAFFPMSLAINKLPNPYVYEAETDIEIRQAPAAEAVNFLKGNPDVMYDLLGRLYRGMDGLLGRMSQLMTGSAKSRLIYELIVETRRFGTEHANGALLDISEKNLGARAGLSRETVSRELHKLKQEGYVDVVAEGIVVKDIAGLEKALGQVL